MLPKTPHDRVKAKNGHLFISTSCTFRIRPTRLVEESAQQLPITFKCSGKSIFAYVQAVQHPKDCSEHLEMLLLLRKVV